VSTSSNESEEWAAQERAMLDARTGANLPSENDELHRYRLVAKALLQEPREPVPQNFAQYIAALAEKSLIPAKKSADLEIPALALLGSLLLAVFACFLVSYGAELYEASTSNTGIECIGLLISLVVTGFARGTNKAHS
jgi:hypothetical protein